MARKRLSDAEEEKQYDKSKNLNLVGLSKKDLEKLGKAFEKGNGDKQPYGFIETTKNNTVGEGAGVKAQKGAEYRDVTKLMAVLGAAKPKTGTIADLASDLFDIAKEVKSSKGKPDRSKVKDCGYCIGDYVLKNSDSSRSKGQTPRHIDKSEYDD